VPVFRLELKIPSTLGVRIFSFYRYVGYISMYTEEVIT
jgi:hypothetical protein